MINYFEYYGLQLKLQQDSVQLKKLFYERSRNTHPDFFLNSSDSEREEALEASTLNNEAYQVLLNPMSRLKHVLQLNNLYASDDKTPLPPAFLMDMMELNEEIEMADISEKKAMVHNKIQSLIQENEESLQNQMKLFDESNVENQKDILIQISEELIKNKYFLRLKQSVSTFADPKNK